MNLRKKIIVSDEANKSIMRFKKKEAFPKKLQRGAVFVQKNHRVLFSKIRQAKRLHSIVRDIGICYRKYFGTYWKNWTSMNYDSNVFEEIMLLLAYNRENRRLIGRPDLGI